METQTKDHKLRKFIYLTVCAVLGVLLFVFIEQTALQLLSVFGIISGEAFTMVNSLAAIAALALGAWYGVWLGSHWYGKVYGNEPTGGFVSHVTATFTKEAEDQTDGGAWQMDDLLNMPAPETEAAPEQAAVQPKKKTVVKRTRTVKAKKVSPPKVSSTTTKRTPPAVPVKKKTARKKVTVS